MGCWSNRPEGASSARGTAMMTMDFWYDMASREPGGLNEEATHLLREAEETLRLPLSQHADEDDE